jgi:hypothetical protein
MVFVIMYNISFFKYFKWREIGRTPPLIVNPERYSGGRNQDRTGQDRKGTPSLTF